MSDLLPCPFCGEAPSIMSVGMAGQPRWQHPVNDTCPIAGHYLGGWDFPVQWNQRALPAVQPDADELVGHMTKLIAAGLYRIEQLTGEVQRWQGMFDEKHNLMLEHKVRAEKAEAERDRLREALSFYANDGWKDRPLDPPTSQEIETFEGLILDFPTPEVLFDRGDRARAALKGESHE